MGRQGVGAAAGARGGQRGVGRVARCRHPAGAGAAGAPSSPGPSPMASTCSPSPAASSARPRRLRWLHPALLTTLVYRGAAARRGPPGPVTGRLRPTASAWLSAAARCSTPAVSGRSPTTPSRTSPSCGRWRRPGSPWRSSTRPTLLTVRMYESAGEAWRGWGRSLSLPGVDPLPRRLGQLAVVALAQALPLVRLVARRGDVLDVVLAGGAPRHARRRRRRPTDHAGWRTGSRRRPMSSPSPPWPAAS